MAHPNEHGQYLPLPKPSRSTVMERQATRRGPHGYRKPERFAKGSDCQDFALPKGPTRHQIKQARRDAEVAQIVETRARVWLRAEGQCEVCSDTERDTAAKWHRAAHEMHEIVSRAQTRGLTPAQRFNTRICCRVCPICHRLLTAHRLEIRVHDDAIGMDGDYDVIAHNGTAPVITPVVRLRKPSYLSAAFAPEPAAKADPRLSTSQEGPR